MGERASERLGLKNIQVLQVAAGERDVRDDLDLSIADLRDGNVVAQVARAAFDLDAVVEELLERREVEDLVADGLAAVDGVLFWRTTKSVLMIQNGGGGREEWMAHTLLVTFALAPLPRAYMFTNKIKP